MTDVSGKVEHLATPEFASADPLCDLSDGDSDLQATIAVLKAENQRLRAELAHLTSAHHQSATPPPTGSSAPSAPTPPDCRATVFSPLPPTASLTAAPFAIASSSSFSAQSAVSDAVSPKPLVQELYRFLDRLTVSCAQSNLLSGRYSFVNQAFCDLLGYSRDELMAMTFYDITHPDDCDRNRAIVQQHIHQPQPTYRLEKRYRHKDGRYLWVDVTVMSVQLSDGGFTPLGIIQDISDRKQIEQQLQRQQAIFQAMFEQAGVGFALVDMTGRYQAVNQKLCEITGYTEAELLKAGFQTVTHPHDLAADEALVQRMLAGEMNHFSLEKRFLRPDGHSIWTRLSASLIRDKQGQPVSISGVVEDIHERIQAEAMQQAYLRDLNTWRSRYEAASRASGQILYERDLEADVVVYGANTERILGYLNADMPSTFAEWLQLVHPEDRQRVHQEMAQSVQQDSMFHLDYRLRHCNGSYIWVEDNCCFFTDSQGNIHRLVGAIQDISDRKQIEEELRRSREMLQVVLDNVPQRIFWKDINSIYLGCNRHQAQAAGLASPEQIIGLHDRDLPWTAEQSETYCTDDAIVLKSDRPLRNILEIQRQSNGQVRWLECHKIPLHDAQSQVVGLVGTAEDITERKQAEDLLVQQAQRERTLNQVVSAIRNSLNLTDIFSTAVREVGHFLDMDWVKVVHYDSDQAVWRVVEAYQRPSFATSPVIVGTQIPDAHAPFAAQLKQGQIIKLDSASLESIALDRAPLNIGSLDSRSDDSPTLNSVLEEDDLGDSAIAQRFPGGWLIIPIRLGDFTWGSLTLMRSHRQIQWSPFDIELAQAIAAQLAIAIQQSELYQQVNQLNITLEQEVENRTAELQQAVHFEALLKRITDRVRDSLNETQILNTVVQELVHGLGALSCDSGRYDLGTRTSTIAYEYVDANSTFTPLDEMVCPMTNFPHIYKQLLHGQSLQICWIPERNLLRPSEQLCTGLACPIIDDQGVIGDLWLYRAASDHFNEMEVRLVQQVANQCAIAVRQARLYQASQAQVDELARLNQLKDDFLSTVSHELRTPMSSIQMAVQMLEITFQKLGLQFDPSHPVSTYLHILQSECNREISLINDLLDLSRLEAEVEPLELMPIEPHLWLSHIAEPFLQRTRLQQQQLLLDLPASLPSIVTDLSYLERAVTELLHNACKYTPPNETIQLAAQANHAGVHVQVINTGVTIPDAERDRIFDKFYRIPNGDPWKHGGTGLGLALVKKLVERLDGSIGLENPPNHVIFNIQLPLCHSHAK